MRKQELRRTLLGAAVCIIVGSSIGSAQQTVVATLAGGVPPPTPLPAVYASLGSLGGVATDGAGNVYFVSQQAVFKVDTQGNLTLVAGTGRAGFSGDGGLATNAQIYGTDGLAIDKAGNIFIADNSRIRKVSTNGVITTIAGSNLQISSGDGGPAVKATISEVGGLAINSAGDLFFSDVYTASIRKISATGIVTSVAGNGAGFGGDGGSALKAQFDQPEGLSLDTAGNIYVADSLNNRIRKISPSGIVSTIAGNGECCEDGDGNPAVQAKLFFPQGVTWRSGTVYVADGDFLRAVQPDGTIVRIAGAGSQAALGDGGPAASAQLTGLGLGIAFDDAGNLYVAENSAWRLRKISASGTITTLAGNGLFNYSGDGGLALAAQLGLPSDLALDRIGDIYVGDWQNSIVRRISPTGGITRVAGTGTAGYSGDGGPAIRAEFHLSGYGNGLAIDNSGSLYIADTQSNRIRRVSADGIVTTVAGTGNAGYSGDGGPAVNADFVGPSGLLFDPAGNLYVAEFQRIRKISPEGTVTTVAGRPGDNNWGFSGDGGLAINAELFGPCCMALDAAGNLYISDTGNNRVREVSRNGIIATVAGNGTCCGGDGNPALQAGMSPRGLAADTAGNLYIVDVDAESVRVVSSDGMIRKWVGGGFGYSGDGGLPGNAQFRGPLGLAIDPTGTFYITDSFNSALRIVQPVTITNLQNAASNLPGPIAPGEILVLTGAGLGPPEIVGATPDPSGRYSTEVSGTSVQFDGVPAPVLYTLRTQVAVVVPYSVTGPTAQVVVSYQTLSTAAVSTLVTSTSPAVFTSDSTGRGQAAAVNQDGSINTAQRPAHVGDFIEIYMTGEGQTTPSGVDGAPATLPYPQPRLPVTVTIGNQKVAPIYAGGAPGEVAGLMQVDVQIPNGIQTGSAVPISVQVGNASSPSGVTIAIQ